jgi:hypothetical protein
MYVWSEFAVNSNAFFIFLNDLLTNCGLSALAKNKITDAVMHLDMIVVIS